MSPNCRYPKVSDCELVNLSIREPRFDPGLLHFSFAGIKSSNRSEFLKQYSVFQIKVEALDTKIFPHCFNSSDLTANSINL